MSSVVDEGLQLFSRSLEMKEEEEENREIEKERRRVKD